jgi:hypothetical protein
MTISDATQRADGICQRCRSVTKFRPEEILPVRMGAATVEAIRSDGATRPAGHYCTSPACEFAWKTQ